LNIFVLDKDIKTCARYHCDQHVIKMILESVQIMCTVLNKKGYKTPYRSTHVKHPCVLWTEKSYDNFLWLRDLVLALNDEYRYRFMRDKDHKSIEVLREIEKEAYEYERLGLTEFPQAMPEQYKRPGAPVDAYRMFYIGEKMKFARWTRQTQPEWI
jgi:hypothetical protein